MKPFQTLAQVRTPRGDQLSLHEHDGDYFLKLNGRALMNSTGTASEVLLAELSCRGLPAAPRILIGGLGMGFTLKRVLQLAPANAIIHVAELIPEVIAWNREFLVPLNGPILDDPRVEVFAKDVFELIRAGKTAKYDCIILDVDNGPIALVAGKNARLYEQMGFHAIRRALTPQGIASFWSADEDLPFVRRISKSGFTVETVAAKSHASARRLAHRIYIATPRLACPP